MTPSERDTWQGREIKCRLTPMPSYGTLRFYRIFDCYHRLDAEKYLFTEWNIYNLPIRKPCLLRHLKPLRVVTRQLTSKIPFDLTLTLLKRKAKQNHMLQSVHLGHKGELGHL